MGALSFDFVVGVHRLRFSPVGELLSFASPKESNQRKGDPTSLPCGSPIWRVRPGAPPTRPGKAHKTCLAAELGHGSALFPPAHAKSAALQGTKANRLRLPCPYIPALVSAKKPLVCRREAQPDGGERRGVSEPARASSRAAPAGEHRREAEGRHTRGGFFFGHFLLATQKKVTRPQAKSEAFAHPRKLNLHKRHS